MANQEVKETWLKGYLLMKGGSQITFDAPKDELDSTIVTLWDTGKWSPAPGDEIYIGSLHVPAENVIAVEIEVYQQ